MCVCVWGGGGGGGGEGGVCVCNALYFFFFLNNIYVNSFGRTMLYMCIEYYIYVNMYHVSA